MVISHVKVMDVCWFANNSLQKVVKRSDRHRSVGSSGAVVVAVVSCRNITIIYRFTFNRVVTLFCCKPVFTVLSEN